MSMRTLSRISILFVFLLLCTTAVHAQDYVRFRLPLGTRLTVAGETYQGFNLGEYRALLVMDEDLRELTTLQGINTARITSLATAATEYQLAVTGCETQVSILAAERVRLTALWTEENRLRNLAESSSWSWLPWTLAGVFLVSTVTLALVVGLQ